jgi:hypothetical protein
MHLRLEHCVSPVGDILAVTDHDENLRALDFGDFRERMERLLTLHYGRYTLVPTSSAGSLRPALDA